MDAAYLETLSADTEALIEFVRESPPDESILFHCVAGVSRSPATPRVSC